MSWSFILVAAGRGERLGGTPKQFVPLGGMPLWRWSAARADRLYRKGALKELVVVLPAGVSVDVPVSLGIPVLQVAGGSERALSVANGVRAATGSHVLVHDAARPFLSESLCLHLMEAAEREGGAIPILPVADAVKRIACGEVAAVDRDGLYLTQTPQAFSRRLLLDALERQGSGARDEAEAWLAAGHRIASVEGERGNFKITYEDDLEMARRLANGYASVRTGHGFDVHPLVPERPLVLAGMTIPSPLGLSGHSDADVLAHTVADALLGAAGEPDIGTLFPASDERFRGADSMELLRIVVQRLFEAGWRVRWVDVTLVAQVPRLGKLVGELAERLSQEIGPLAETPGKAVNLKVKSGEKLGSVGRAEGMTCHAVSTLFRMPE